MRQIVSNLGEGKNDTMIEMKQVFAPRRLTILSLCTSLVLRGERLEVPGILQGFHLVVHSPTEQADEVQAMQLEF